MICDYCKNDIFYLKEQDGRTALFCKSCGRWLKWVDSIEKAKIEMDIEKRKRELKIDGADLEIVREKYRTYKKKHDSLADEIKYYKERTDRKQTTNEMEAAAMYDKVLKLKELTAKLAAYDEVLLFLRLR